MAAGLVTVPSAPVIHPRRGFRLQVNAQPVGRLERRLGRAPGVKAHVVEPVFLDDAQHPLPFGHGHGRMAGLADTPRSPACRAGTAAGRSAAFPCPTRSTCRKPNVTLASSRERLGSLQGCANAVADRMKLVPCLGGLGQR